MIIGEGCLCFLDPSHYFLSTKSAKFIMILKLWHTSNYLSDFSLLVRAEIFHHRRPNHVFIFMYFFIEGLLKVDEQVPSFQELNEKFSMLQPGGQHQPPECLAHQKVALIIPYRDRQVHLKIFLNNIHPFLQRQQLDYGIYVVEMVNNSVYNIWNFFYLPHSFSYCWFSTHTSIHPENPIMN